MIPLLHDFEGETVLVLGGGPVGARKARRFAEEARVVVVSPEFCDRSFEPGEARRHPDAGVGFVRDAPDAEGVRGYVERLSPALVVAATDIEAVNEAAAEAAREAGALVNRADQHGGRAAGSVVVPATVRDDPVVAAVATGGAAPALSKHLRERIEAEVYGAGAMAELLGELRDELQHEGVSPKRRRGAVRAIITDDSVWKHLAEDRAKSRRIAEDVVADVPEDTP
jgi:precorrin-2 dehydrogenase/sirohydrochlorin ferrochelatase